MYKLLIVDDEPVTREGISDFIRSNDFGIDVVRQADSGEEALKIVDELRPDIILSDIKMPGVDGIEFAQIIRSKYPGIKIIFISGYDDTDYLHSAFKVDAVDYILKPVKLKELRAVLGRVTNCISREQDKEKRVRDMENKLMKSMPLLRQRFFMLLINGRENDEDSIAQQCDFLGIKLLQSKRLCAICVNIINYEFPDKIKDRQCLSFAVLNILQELVDKFMAGYVFENSMGEFVGILDFGHEDYEKDFFEFADMVKKSFKEAINMDVIIGVGEMVDSLSKIHMSYSQANCAAMNKMFIDTDSAISMDSLSGIPNDGFIINERVYDKLINCLRTADSDGVKAIISDIFDILKKRDNLNTPYCFNVCIQLLFFGMKFFSELGMYSGATEIYEHQTLKKLTHTAELDEMKTVICEHYGYLCMQIGEKRTKRGNNPVDKIKAIVDEKYSEDLTINDIAEEVFLSPTYMCFIFKQKTGMTINEYLTFVRIEAAKKLLSDSSLKLSEVSRRVGYPNTSYFSKLFKKRVGCNPSEYNQNKR